ncbi:limbic system-associated membrane protein-like [Actinia tenebrosa]|uniref:Limbic system-associated membrane protein-like n=1 Tax=Actinia tenebrosa TaxID=6105 RepID=A0A6P8H257_ACTTE|nr:limbic system-associated membrane protein-like [Actinia tenebrosa]
MTTYHIIEGQYLKINCTAIGPPTPNITWVYITDGSVDIMRQGSGSAVLHIDNIKRYHAGVYECQAKNIPNEDPTTTRTSVTVYYPPEITHLSNDKIIDEGSLIELNCLASGYPLPNIIWSKGSFLQYGSNLRIPRAIRSDAGNFTCTANNSFGTSEHLVKAHIYVTVRYKPSIVQWTKDQIVNETDPLHLTCKADGNPTPNFTWTKSQGSMTLNTTGNEYRIHSVNRSDAGTYTCTAHNEIGSAGKKINVVVQYKPSIFKHLSSTDLSSWSGRQAIIKCTFDGLPTPVITWYKPNDRQTGAKTIANSSQIMVITTNDANYGSYKCKATNIAGSAEQAIIVTQLRKPTIPKLMVVLYTSKDCQYYRG